MQLLCSALIKTDHILHHILSIHKYLFNDHFPLCVAKEEWAGGI